MGRNGIKTRAAKNFKRAEIQRLRAALERICKAVPGQPYPDIWAEMLAKAGAVAKKAIERIAAPPTDMKCQKSRMRALEVQAGNRTPKGVSGFSDPHAPDENGRFGTIRPFRKTASSGLRKPS